MALSINRALSDSASTACFEVANNAGGEAETIIDVSELSGAGTLSNQSVIIKRVVATVTNTDAGATSSFVTLSWGDGTNFLHLGSGKTDLDITFRTPNAAGDNDADVTVTSEANVFYTLRIYAKKMIGFPLSMGHGPNRP